MKFYMVWLADRNGNIMEAEICADYCVGHVEKRLKEHAHEGTGDELHRTEIGSRTVKLHWSAQLLRTREGGDLDTGWEG